MNAIRITGWWIAAAVGALILLFGSRLLALYVEWLWFGELGRRAVFWTILTAQAQLALIFGTSLFLAMLLNVWLARRTSPSLTPRFDDFPLRVRIGRAARTGLSIALLASSLGIGLLAALEATGNWDAWLRFRHHVPFHQTDPIFHRDIGFYIFILPFWKFLYARLFVGLLVVLAGTALVYYLDRAMEFLQGYARVASSARAHLSVLLGLLMLAKAWGYRLDMYDLVLTPGAVVHGLGAGYTEVHARLPALFLLMGLALVAAAGFFLNAHLRLLSLPVAAVALMVVASLLVGSFYPGFVQRFQVTPNEQAVQEPFIRHHLQLTRAAYGLDRVKMRDFALAPRLSPAAIPRNAGTINNIRLWDYTTLRLAYQQLQSFRNFYVFKDVDIDRYRFTGRYRQVMLSPRELDPDKLGATAQRWVNRRLEYTHGYGLVMSPVNEVNATGRPVFLVSDIPLTSAPGTDLRIDRPQIYYGEVTQEPVIVRTQVSEFDYVTSAGTSQVTRYEGRGGIPLGAWLTRALFATVLSDTNLLISNALTAESKLLIRRNILDRAMRLAPFLMYDRDPYLAVADGRLVWIHDAYTTADTYPYSQPLSHSVPANLRPFPGEAASGTPETVNYIRNSVKIVTDAYDGTVTFYVADDRDPVLQAYRAIFPSMWRPMSAMPPDLRAHIRYPETLFTIQARMYTSYHVTDPGTFYAQSDLWQVPPEPSFSRSTSAPPTLLSPSGPIMPPGAPSDQESLEPYYVTMRLPEEAREEFLLILPLNYGGKPNMAAWLAARSDGARYGELVSYVFPRGTQTVGPEQVAAFINQDPTVSQQLTLWGQQGSSVIWGNLLVIPIERSLLYVVPLFLSATSQAGIPEMKRVVLFHAGRVVMAPTLSEAIREMFQASAGEEPAAPVAGAAPGGTPLPPAAVSARVRALAETAARQLEEATNAQRRGDWARYGAALKRLEAAIRELRRATSP